MYAGKTEELMRLARREFVAGRKVVLFKPCLDDRYSKTHIDSHNKSQLPAVVVKNTKEIMDYLAQNNVDVIGIDEIHFFTDDVVNFCVDIVQDKSKRVKIIAGGLSKDFRGEPFKFMNSHRHIGELMPHAASIIVLHAICTYKDKSGNICGKSADYSQRLIDGKPAPYDSPLILVGSTECYEARCGQHYHVPGRKKLLQFIDKS